MKAQLKHIQEKQKSFSRRPSLYIEIDLPTWTVGKKSFITEAIYLCGAENIFSGVPLPALQANKESILAKNPEIILSWVATQDEIIKRPGWQEIEAVKKGNIIDDFPRDLLSHGNHRLMEGMEILQEKIEEVLEK